MSAVRSAETRAEMIPEKEHDQQTNEDIHDTPEEKEQLYIEILQTISNSVGAPAPGGQVCISNLFTAHKKMVNYCLFFCLLFISPDNDSNHIHYVALKSIHIFKL